VRHETHRHALRNLIEWLHRNGHIRALCDIKAVIYHIPHGGTRFKRATRLSHHDLHDLRALSHATPDMRSCVATVESGMRVLSGARHICVFDTAFTASLPPEAAIYPLSKALRERYALRRYGAHGLIHKAAYEEGLASLSFSKRVGRASGRKTLPRRIISIHVGEAVSVVAIADGIVVETSDGFTAAESLPGLHNSGAIDHRIPFYLSAHLREHPSSIDALLMRRSGIAAMTGKKSYDAILAGVRKNNKDCATAMMILWYRIAQSVAGMSAAFGEPTDMLVFSGEGASWAVREEVCRRLRVFGVRLGKQEKRVTGTLSSPSSKVLVVAVHVDLQEAVLRDAQRLIG